MFVCIYYVTLTDNFGQHKQTLPSAAMPDQAALK